MYHSMHDAQLPEFIKLIAFIIFWCTKNVHFSFCYIVECIIFFRAVQWQRLQLFQLHISMDHISQYSTIDGCTWAQDDTSCGDKMDTIASSCKSDYRTAIMFTRIFHFCDSLCSSKRLEEQTGHWDSRCFTWRLPRNWPSLAQISFTKAWQFWEIVSEPICSDTPNVSRCKGTIQKYFGPFCLE